MKIRAVILFALIFLAHASFAQRVVYRPVMAVPPEPPREFRGAWITVVADHQDWPSKPNLTVEQQKAELISLLDRAVQLHLNAVIFQVRPACDAVYSSSIEPWSAYLTGTQGKAPEPFYDPLAFAIEEAHKRGLELHAWFNPFRAWHTLSKSPVAANHIMRTHPELVRRYGDQFWLDPGEPAVRDYVQHVVLDVVRRYDVDGVQFDDYFYPYPQKDSAGRAIPFPDEQTWKKYGLPNGFDLENWRRQNINRFIQGVYQGIKAEKPWVKFGVSPFGIWRPTNPAQIRGMDAYATLYADSRLWLNNGWADYFAPQLYWPIDDYPHSFTALLGWWTLQNTTGKNIFAAINAAGVGEKFSADEIGRQISAARSQPGAGGEIFFHLRSLTDNPEVNRIVTAQFSRAALVPASPWLDAVPPQKPKLTVQNTRTNAIVHWENSGDETARLWVLQARDANGNWLTQILPAGQTEISFGSPLPDLVCVSAVDRLGNQSPAAAVRKNLFRADGRGMFNR